MVMQWMIQNPVKFYLFWLTRIRLRVRDVCVTTNTLRLFLDFNISSLHAFVIAIFVKFWCLTCN